MPLLRITNGFDKMSDANLEVKANSIYTSLLANALTYFPNPSPTLPALKTFIDDFSAALFKAKTGSLLDKALKNEKKANLISALHEEGAYVLLASAGNTVIAQASGYTIAKVPTPKPPVGPATNQQLENGPNSGDMKYSFDPTPGSKAFVYQSTPDPLTENSVWASQGGTARKTMFTGLEPGKKYWFRVMSIGKNGQTVYSDPVSKIVQ